MKQRTRKHKDKHNLVQKEKRLRNRKIIDEAKSKGCILCPELNICCLDFHHTHGKDYIVSRMLCYSVKRLQEEIAKCVVLCANCHRKVHAKIIAL